ncbi:hypothetical protein A3Q56_02477 [Intoshia linei]|uniref:Ubiquitin/SUMO-activating enzyme ubiquitin-like domain-containing protein n=1 Tax=Intoshia linei TaxID=1819745 RepID=A0A177B6L0_9BILA|nr:hypothetical protein A3Q56_02477 [Intoshia linei]
MGDKGKDFFYTKILINELLLKEPDVIIKSTGSILISSDSADYNEDHMNKVLSSFDVKDGCVLICDDFSQDYILNLNLKEFKETELISLENSESDQVMYEIIQKTIVDVPTQRTDIEGQAYESDSDDLVIQTSKYDSEFEIETVEEIGGKRPKPIITDINIKLQKID